MVSKVPPAQSPWSSKLCLGADSGSALSNMHAHGQLLSSCGLQPVREWRPRGGGRELWE